MTDKDIADKAAFYFRLLPPQDRVAMVNAAEEPSFWRNKFPDATDQEEFGERLKALSDEEIASLFKSVAGNPANWTKPAALSLQ